MITIKTFSIPIYIILVSISIFSMQYYTIHKLRKTYNNIYYLIPIQTLCIITFAMILNIINTKAIGFTSSGGALGVIISDIIFIGLAGIGNNKLLLNTSITSISLAYSISKIGCLLGGCCIGIKYCGLFSIKYTDNISRLPIQLLESIMFLTLFMIFNQIKLNYDTMIITYSALKFLLDYFRYYNDSIELSTNQIYCIIAIIICLIIKGVKKIKCIKQ